VASGRPGQGPRLVSIKRKGYSEPVWFMRWHEHNHTRERSTGTTDSIEAQTIFGRWLVEHGKAFDRPTTRWPSEMAIVEALTLYGERHAVQLPSAARVGYAMTALINWWGDKCVEVVNPESCNAYTRYRLGQGVKSGTAAKELSTLRAAINYCVKNGHLSVAPFVQMPPKTPGRNRWLTRSEAARLLNASRRSGPHLGLFILIALYTGARHGAILGLRWDDQIDLERGRIDFNEPGRPVTNKRRPIIPVPRQLLWFLRAVRRRSDSPRVISYQGGGVRSVKHAFVRARARAGLGPDVTAHTLRHTCGTWLAQAGVDLYQIAGWLGHTSERTTELYAHHSPDHFEAARRAIERR
jgi:integrase